MSETHQQQEATFPIGSVQISIKDVVLIIPMLTAALALAYDVGYFLGADLRLFTFFTLSEHLVFALQGVPLMVALMIYVWSAVIVANIAVATEFFKAYIARKRMPIVDYAVNAFALAFLATLVFTRLRAVAALMVLGLLVVRSRRRRSKALVPIIVIGLFCTSFAFGVDFSRFDRISHWADHSIEMIDGRILDGKIIRAGERNILIYFDDLQQYRVLRSDAVRTVDSTRGDYSDLDGMMRRYMFE